MLTLEVAHVIVAIVVVVVLIAAAALISWKSAIIITSKWEKLRWEAQRRKPEKSLTMH